MNSDKDLPQGASEAMDPEEESRERSLKWLLEMDLEEPEDTLFQVSDAKGEQTLSAFEEEVASRPLVRGGNGDSIDQFVDEEIVLTADTGSDIFEARSESTSQADAPAESAIMAVDYTRDRTDQGPEAKQVEEGSDVLGLSAEDDIGDTFLAIKRVRSARQAQQKAAADAGSQSIEQVEEQAPSAAELVQQDKVQEDAAAQVAAAEVADTGDISTNLETSGEFIEITPTAADETLDMST
ncbi:MAG: hypothetical protein HKN19_15415, partial [Halioglobus sp.]|nr:hypothetical protein [Halioglobus sp.]